ncbi:hypothetical protein SOV_35150 [Sporomusa ovata DSM 2662]|uniref:Uncharacterized protein n=1 Tax=Sporomusa ovata TaxID=2378 RepID=A0A0U1L5N8_9FIRM|nr:HEPN domain-containing protein [Sporomusa ovata]EQB24664.1 hypothetical protein SOV_6c00780 [Sporomusa ovata DSM 2662]CQR75011.1 hypothetical protein SpAn4DRAFT_4375 [Sporomusa ovata]
MDIPRGSEILSDIRNDKNIRAMRSLWPQLTSRKNFDIPRNIDDYKKIASISKAHLNINGEEWYFNDKNQPKLRELVNNLYQISEISNMVSYNSVWKNVEVAIRDTITSDKEEKLISFQQRLELIINSIFSEVRSYEFYWAIEGIDLIDINEFAIGDLIFFNFNNEYYKKFKAEPDINDFYRISVVPFLDKNFANKVVVKCMALGDKDHAEGLAREKVEESLNYIRFMFCYINSEYVYDNKWKVYYDIKTTQESGCFLRRNPENNSTYLAYSPSKKIRNNFPISKKTIDTWGECYFLDSLGEIMKCNSRMEWEEAILTSIHWIGEAQHEWAADVALWKYWTAIESLIPPNKDEVTQSVLKGTAVLIVYTGYRFVSVTEFWSTYKRVKDLYDKRSRITHSGLSRQVMPDELRDVCQYASWLILAAVGLHSQGYRKFEQVQEQIDRLYGRKRSKR